MKTYICLIRHGQTDWNSRGLIQGITDNPLNSKGIEQAENAANLLLKTDPNWDIILPSPLSRAYNTALIIAKYLNYEKEIIKNPLFQERKFGVAEGEILNKKMYEEIFQEKIPGMEKLSDLKKRGIEALLEIDKKYSGKRVIVTTHSQFIKGILAALDKDFDFTMYLKNSSLNYFSVDNGKIEMIKYNITE